VRRHKSTSTSKKPVNRLKKKTRENIKPQPIELKDSFKEILYSLKSQKLSIDFAV
jgi:hypothetical protein